MDPLFSRVRRAHRQLVTQRLLQAAVKGAIWGSVLVILYIIIDRVFVLGGRPLAVASALVGAPVLFFLARALFRMPSLHDAAVEIDERFGLSERVATALSLQGDPAEVPVMVRHDANRYLQHLKIGEKIPLHVPPEARWLFVIILALAFLAHPGIFPYFDVLRKAEAKEQLAEEQKQVRIGAKKLQKATEKFKKKLEGKKLSKDVKDVIQEMERAALDLEADPQSKRDTLLEMSKLSDKIQEKKDQAKYQDASTKAKALQSLRNNAGITKDIQTALQKGDLKAAAKALDKLQEEMKAGNLSPELMDKLTEELKSLSMDLAVAPELADALAEAAQDITDDELQDALENLEEAEMTLEEMAEALEELAMLEEMLEGLDDQRLDLFMDEDELAELLEDAHACNDCGGNMEEAWKFAEDLAQKAEGDEAVPGEGAQKGEQADCPECDGAGCEACDGTGKQGGQKGQKGQDGEGDGEKAGGQKGGQEGGKEGGDEDGQQGGHGKQGAKKGGGDKGDPKGSLDKQKQKMVCRRCVLEKYRQMARGMGGPGQGRGGKIPDEPYGDAGWQKKKVKGQMGKGRIVGEMFVEGAQVKGDASEDYVEVLGEARQEAADALSKERIPREYRDFVREYFNSLDPEGN